MQFQKHQVVLLPSNLPAYTVTYYKIGRTCYVDHPEYIAQGGDPEDLERIGAFHDLLELMAAAETTVVVEIDVEPFEGADVFELTGSSGGNTGGYYHLPSFRGHAMEVELWLDTYLYFTLPKPPQRIYFRQLDLPGNS